MLGSSISMSGGGGGSGDMLKSTYDSDEDGVIDTGALGSGTADNTTYLRGDSTWQTVSGIGDMTKAEYDTNDDGIVNEADVAGVAHGSTFPGSPASGDLFVLELTGRKILYSYGTWWTAVCSLGAAPVVYVDPSGTDNMYHGFGPGTDAFATIQYAINLLPKNMSGNPSIYLGAGTYNETPSVQTFMNNSINFYGALTPVADLTATGGYVGYQSNAAYVSGTFTAAAHDDLLIRFKADTTTVALRGVKRIISKTTTTRLWLVGGLPDTPVNGDTYEVCDWSTVITGTFVANYALVNLTDIKVVNSANTQGALYIYPYGRIGAVYCRFENTYASAWGAVCPDTHAQISLWYSLLKTTQSNTDVVHGRWTSEMEFQACKLIGKSKTGSGIKSSDNTMANIESCEIEACAYGVRAMYGGQTMLWWDRSTYNFIHGCTTGIYSETLGANQLYSGITVYTDIDGTADANTANTADTQSMGTVSVTSITDSGLTSGQIPVAGTGGLLGNGPAYSSNTITASTAWTKALGSDHTWSGAVSTLTAGTSLVLGDLCYIGSDGKMEKAQGDAATHVPVVAFCTDTIAEDATGVFLMQGFVRDDSWNWTPGTLLYIDDDTAGLITATLPADTGDQDQIVGIAVTADIIYFNPNYMVIEHA